MESSSQTTVSSSLANRTLVIMAKAPKAGRVKTRLSQSLPSLAVTALYRCLLGDTVELAKSLRSVKVAVMCPQSDRGELADLLANTVPIVAQNGEGLAAGLTSVFGQFTAAGRQHVIAFNSDSPHLAPSVLERAFEILATHDVVVGPTQDGGYYLVGAKAAYPSLFEGDGMGTGNALDRLLTLRSLNLQQAAQSPFYDIDVADDLILLARELQLAPGKAPRTATWFHEWEQAVTHLRRSLGEL